MGLRPAFRLAANREDITAVIRERFVGLSLTDEAGTESDTLEVTLADHDPERPIVLPPTGAELDLALGYDDRVQRMGLFVVDELEVSGWPGAFVIRARAAPHERSMSGMSDLQSQRSRSWERGTTIADVIDTIAGEHGMEAAVAPALEAIELPHIDQVNESDMAFVLRLAGRYDAIAKTAGGRLVFAERGKGASVSGTTLPTIAVAARDCMRWQATIARRDSPGTVIAYWHDTDAAERREVSVGEGRPVRRLRHDYPDEDAAEAAARAELARRERGEMRLSLSLPGDPRIAAESPLRVSGFRREIDGEWIVTRVTHSLDSGGYVCEVEAETR